MDMSRVIPSDAYLDTFAISTTTPDQASAAVTEPTTTELPIFVGTIQTGGKGLTVETLSTYLTRLESGEGLGQPVAERPHEGRPTPAPTASRRAST